MFSTLSTIYLFFGGAGAGCCVVSAVLTLSLVLKSDSTYIGVSHLPSVNVPSFFSQSALRRLKAILNMIGLAALIFGAACLSLDLGRADRALLLFLSPTFSYLSVGAFLLLATILLSGSACVFDVMQPPFNVSRTAAFILTMFLIATSLGTMTYTGLLLTSLTQVHLWNSPFIVALFVLSSLSCGAAVTMVVGMFEEAEEATVRVIPLVVKVDTVILVVEIIIALVWCATTLETNTYAQPAAANLFLGEDATLSGLWWGGFIALGAAVPLVIEIVMRVRVRSHLIGELSLRKALLALAGVLIVVGAFCMRFSIAEAGLSRMDSSSQIVWSQTDE